MLIDKIQKVHKDSGYIYGSTRITAELDKEGDVVSRSYVARLMTSPEILIQDLDK